MDVIGAAELTDLRDALEALRASEARFRAAFEENPETIGIYRPIVDEQGRFLDAELLYENRTGRDRYFGGLPLARIAGSRQFEAWPLSRPLLYDLFAGFVERRGPDHAQLHGVRSDGEYWSEVSLFRFDDGFVLVGRDVTDSVLAQRERDETELRSRTVLDTMLDAVVIMRPVRDDAGEVVDLLCDYINKAAIVGDIPPAQLIGTRLLTWWPDARSSGLFEAALRVLATGEPLVLDGQPFVDPMWTGATRRLLDMRAHRVGEMLVGTWRDVTVARNAAEALAASEARYAQFVEGIPLGIFRARASPDGSMAFEYMSAQAGRVVGVDPKAAVLDATVVFSMVHPDDLPELARRNAQTYATHSRFDWEGRSTVRGEERIIRVASQPAETAGDELVWHGFIEDVTEQRHIAEALEASEERYRLLADNANDVIWTMSPDGRVTYVSPSVQTVRGLTPEQAMHQTIDQIHPAASQAISLGYFETLAADLAAGRQARSLLTELEYYHANGGTVWCEVRVIPRVGPDGRVFEIIGLSRDISERKRREADERRFAVELERRVAERTAELQIANEELRSFSYSVSHDLRAPVRAVAGFARILQRDYGDRLDAEGLHKLDNIMTAGHTMGRLIDDLLAYTRVGQGSLSLGPVPLEPVVDGLRVALAARLAETGATLEALEPLATPVGDRSLIDRILLNLVDNAIAYHRPGVPPHIRLSAQAAAGGVTIAVADNGVGIPRDAWERVFDVFTRLSTDDEESRSGIGLATVRRAARAMGSEVTLDSTVGEGTTFRFTLPAALPAG